MGLFDGAAGQRRARPPPRRWRSCCGRRWCWWSTRRRSRRSVAALVHGFASCDPRVRIGGRDPQPGRLGPARGDCCGRRWTSAGVPVLGVLRRTDAGRHAVPAPRAGPGGRAARRGRRAVDARWRELVAARLRPGRAAGAGPAARRALPGPGVGSGRRAGRRAAGRGRPADRRRRRAPRSPSRYAEHAELLDGGRAPRSSRSTRCATSTCPTGPAGWSSAAASPRCTRRSCPPTSRCATAVAALAAPRRAGRRRVRRAALPGPRRWTASRCAACWTPRPR